MSEPTDDAVLDAVTSFYLESSRFNGIPLDTLADRVSFDREKLKSILARLVESRQVDVVFDADGDPHVKRLAPVDPKQQTARLNGAESTVCVYPTAEILSQVELSGLDDRPYTRCLALGEPQLTPVFFELSVLERYLGDSRYVIDFDDVVGVIADTTRPSGRSSDEGTQFLPSFGVGYRAGGFRLLLVYMTNLANMSADHQRYWKEFEVGEQCVANSDYLDTTSFGKPRQYTSIYAALLGELSVLNALCERIGKPPLFLRTYPDLRPTGFHGMLCPTRPALSDFLVLLDGLLSENLNREFFRGETDLDLESTTTIDLLQDWLAARFTVSGQPDVVRAELAPIRAVRDMRHGPAAALGNDEYDLEYAKKQDRLVANVYGAVRWLRRVLQEHPHARGDTVPAWLDGENIVVY